jgi:uncharacterized protein (DUF1697 family)
LALRQLDENYKSGYIPSTNSPNRHLKLSRTPTARNMKKDVTGFVALLRGVNVGGNNAIPMSALCSLCNEIGYGNVQSYIQSGNLVFSTAGSQPALEAELEAGIERHFGLSIPVVVRAAVDWRAYVQNNPFPEASRSEPNRVMLALSKRPPKLNAARDLCERATNGEPVIQAGDALLIHFPGGVGKSKLTPSLLDRVVGSSVTMRNWRTVVKLGEMVMQVSGSFRSPVRSY